jgi:hypothetical protein
MREMKGLSVSVMRVDKKDSYILRVYSGLSIGVKPEEA